MGGQIVGQAQERVGQVQEKAGQVVGQAGQVVGQAGQVVGQVPYQMRERAGQMQQQAQGFWQMMESNPVAVGALGTVLGGVAGLLIPETEKENQLMGETRDRVVGSVQEMAGETVAKAQRVAEEAGKSAMEAGQAAIEEVNSQQGSTGQSGSVRAAREERQRLRGVFVDIVPAGRRPTVGVQPLQVQRKRVADSRWESATLHVLEQIA